MIHPTKLFLANTFDANSPVCFLDVVIVWYAVWPKATKVTNSCWHFSVVPWDAAFSYPHFVVWVIDMVCSNYIADQVLPEDDVESFHLVHCEAPLTCGAVIPLCEFQMHLLPSFNAVFYLGIRRLHDQPATISLF